MRTCLISARLIVFPLTDDANVEIGAPYRNQLPAAVGVKVMLDGHHSQSFVDLMTIASVTSVEVPAGRNISANQE